ncbi:DNA cytosine methyltransferase [Sphingomonas sp. IBVSS2]|uniref:DNA cytosine methyltransferase n=1 Tax=Sphingomonas sp. IBVSS2 TaxID=1985172 RepID=UPI002119C242|nr:DNA cytosine methyltransferase [Sphingomonas sp. IBVSS2]
MDVDAMKLVELFCGTGGFSRGAHAAGFEVAAAYDIDTILSSSYPHNFPNTKLHHRDVSLLTGAEVREHVGGEVFGLFGGPPCQGFSDIGRRDKADPRRGLLVHFFRLVAELEPAFFVMENVRGLAYADAKPVLDAGLDLVRHSYDVFGPRIWNAADFGAATTRNRMFVIGVRKDLQAPLTDADIEKYKRPAATVQAAIADLSGAVELVESGDLPGFDRWKIVRRGAPTDYARSLRSETREFTGHRITEHTAAVIQRFSKVLPGGMDKIGRHPRLAKGGLCPTLRAGTGAERGSYQSVRPIHPDFHRVITVREAARLQGFPDWHVFHPTVWHSFRMIGNSVSPIMSGAVFAAIRDRLGLTLPSTDCGGFFLQAAE